MRRSFFVFLPFAMVVACSGVTVDADFVAVDLYVTFETKLGIDVLEIRAATIDDQTLVFGSDFEITPATVVTATRTARIVLSGAPEYAGRDVRLTVRGLDEQQTVVGASSTRVPLRLGIIATATVSIGTPMSCGDGVLDDGEDCDPGATPITGCTAACRAADGFICGGTPSRCSVVGRTALVDADATTCPGTGAPDEPFCAVSRAIMAPWAETIVVRAGTYRGQLTIDRAVQIVADPNTIIEASEVPAIDVRGGDVRIERFTVRGLTGVGGGIAVRGSGTALELSNASVGPTSTVGITLRDGALLRLFQTRVERNAGGGLELSSDTGFIVENVVVANNGALANGSGGVFITRAAPTARLSNVTIANNDGDALDCRSSARVINTIAWGGVVTSTTVSACTPVFSNYGPLEAGTDLPTGSFSIPPRLTDDQHLDASSPCRDTGDPDAILRGDAPTVDIDGESRPRGPNIDIGADEF